MVVYQYVCRCECRYVGRTSQRLQVRIRQHVPKTIRNKTNQEKIQPTRKSKIKSSTPNCDSAIGTHLLKHPNCALHYNDNQFSILSKARSEFHLALLESIHTQPQANLHCAVKKSSFIGLNYQDNYIGFNFILFQTSNYNYNFSKSNIQIPSNKNCSISNSTKRQNFLLFDRLVVDAYKSTALLYNFLLGETKIFYFSTAWWLVLLNQLRFCIISYSAKRQFYAIKFRIFSSLLIVAISPDESCTKTLEFS